MKIPVAAACLLLPIATGIGNPSVEAEVVSTSREENAVQARLMRPCCPSVVEVSGEFQDGPERVEVRSRLSTLEKVTILPGSRHVLVEGSLGHGGEVVLVLSTEGLDLAHEVWAYGHWLSPDGRYMVYQRHYPRLGPREWRKSEMAVLTLDESPTSPSYHRGFASDTDHHEASGASARPVPSQDTEERSFWLASPVQWTSQESFAYVLLRQNEILYELVEVTIDGDGGMESVSRLLDLSELEAASAASPLERGQSPQGLKFHFKKIEATESGLRFDLQGAGQELVSAFLDSGSNLLTANP